MLLANNDPELSPWLWGITGEIPHRAGDFLTSLVEVVFRADWENYEILRPALLKLKEKYPEYHWPAKKT